MLADAAKTHLIADAQATAGLQSDIWSYR